MNPAHILFIDNFDSFVFNLVDEFEKRRCAVHVWRNDIGVERAMELAHDLPHPRLVVISPGPGTPEEAGCCIELVRRLSDVPIFGVCLGMQVLTAACGGQVVPAGDIVHGKSSAVPILQDHPLFAGIASPVQVGRYHSLACAVPSEFEVLAGLGTMPMAIAHRTRPLLGVQFHPESILTRSGGIMIENVIAWAGGSSLNQE